MLILLLLFYCCRCRFCCGCCWCGCCRFRSWYHCLVLGSGGRLKCKQSGDANPVSCVEEGHIGNACIALPWPQAARRLCIAFWPMLQALPRVCVCWWLFCSAPAAPVPAPAPAPAPAPLPFVSSLRPPEMPCQDQRHRETTATAEAFHWLLC